MLKTIRVEKWGVTAGKKIVEVCLDKVLFVVEDDERGIADIYFGKNFSTAVYLRDYRQQLKQLKENN